MKENNMAKSAKPNTTEIMDDEPAVTAALTLTNDDLANIAVAQYEGELLTSQKELEKENKRLAAKNSQITQQIHDEATKRAEELLGERAEKLAKAVAEFCGQEKSPQVSFSFQILGKKNEEVQLQAVVHGVAAYAQKIIAKESSWKALEESVAENQKKIQEQENKLFEIKRELANLPRIERQAKAAMARSALQGTDRGRKILQSLADAKGLPRLLAGS